MTGERASSGPVAPIGVNHIVLNVRNIEESHQFWTEVVGLRLVGEFRQRPGRRMWFYSGIGPDGLHHHAPVVRAREFEVGAGEADGGWVVDPGHGGRLWRRALR